MSINFAYGEKKSSKNSTIQSYPCTVCCTSGETVKIGPMKKISLSFVKLSLHVANKKWKRSKIKGKISWLCKFAKGQIEPDSSLREVHSCPFTEKCQQIYGLGVVALIGPSKFIPTNWNTQKKTIFLIQKKIFLKIWKWLHLKLEKDVTVSMFISAFSDNGIEIKVKYLVSNGSSYGCSTMHGAQLFQLVTETRQKMRNRTNTYQDSKGFAVCLSI